MAKLELSEESLATLVDTFYRRVRADDALGPIFNAAIQDWPDHLRRLSAFWSSVMLGSGRYKGSPMRAHMKHLDKITPALFERWVGLWTRTCAELMEPQTAFVLAGKAQQMSRGLQGGLFAHQQAG